MENYLLMNEKDKQVDVSLPLFQRHFRVRVREGWENFLKGEEKLRALIDPKADSEDITEQLADLLAPAFGDAYAEFSDDVKSVLKEFYKWHKK